MPFKYKSLNLTDKKSKLLGAYIRFKREEENMSISFLSDVLNISKSYLSEIEHGKKTPAKYTLQQILKTLETEYFSEETILSYLHDSIMVIYEKFSLLRIDEAREKIDEILGNKNYYLNSEGFLLYYLIKLISLVKYDSDFNECKYYIKLLDDHITLLDEDEVGIYYDVVATLYIKNGLLDNAQLNLEQCIKQSASLPSSIYGMILYHFALLNKMSGNLIKSLDYCKKSKQEFYSLLNYKMVLYIELVEANIYCLMFNLKDSEIKYLQILKKAQLNDYNDISLKALNKLSWIKLINDEFDECLKYSNVAISKGATGDMILIYGPICYFKKNDIKRCLESINSIRNLVKYPLIYLLDAIYCLCVDNGESFIENLEEYLTNAFNIDNGIRCFIKELMVEYYIKKAELKKVVKIQSEIIKLIKSM